MNSNDDKSSRLAEVKGPHFIHSIAVYGDVIDDQTRCSHYHSPLDIIAIKFKCCDRYYPCSICHETSAGHIAAQWAKNERDTKAVLCGQCGFDLTINEYFHSANQCPSCRAAFNPNCSKHYTLYFSM